MKLAGLIDWFGHYKLLSIMYNDQFGKFVGFLKMGFQIWDCSWYKLYAQANFVNLKLNGTYSHCNRACIICLYCSCIIWNCYFYIFCANLHPALGFSSCSFSLSFVSILWFLSSWLGRLEPIGPPTLLLPPPLVVRGFWVRKIRKRMRSLTLRGTFGLRERFC